MPRSGAGVYTLPVGLPSNGDTSNADEDLRAPLEDVATDLNTPRPILAGGTGADNAIFARKNLGLNSFKDVATLLANTSLSYSGSNSVSSGDVITTQLEGAVYQVASSTATDHALTTAGAVKLYVRGVVTPQHFGAVGNGVTDDRPAFAAMDAFGGNAFIPAPPVRYNFSSALHLGSVAVTIDPSVTWDDLTDGGQLSFYRGRATASIADGSNIHRFQDRTFFGYAATAYAGSNHVGSDVGNSWLPDATVGPAYLAANAGVLFMSGDSDTTDANNQKNAPYGFVAAMRSSDLGGNGPIGFGTAVVHDSAGFAAWGGISEIQRESGAGSVYGWEYAVKNKGDNAVATPTSLVSGGPPGAYGIWFQGGGDNAFGGSAANPSTAAIAVLGGASTWNSGIVFAHDSITTNRAIELSSQTTAGSAHALLWHNAAGNIVFVVQGEATDTDLWTLTRRNSALAIRRGSNDLFQVTGSGDFVNGSTLFTGISGVSPQFIASGPDANLDLAIRPKGTGGAILTDSAGTVRVRANSTGLGFFNVTPVARQSVGSAATDAATTQTLANNLRTALINLGLCQT